MALGLCALALALTGCGSSGGDPDRATGATLTIYESLPRHGTSAQTADAVAAGARLALADAGGRAGGRRVRIVELDSSRPGGETWDPATVEANAKRAADDPTTIAYIGELDEGASAISVPVTNDQKILQVSPTDGFTSLTRDQPGSAVASGPERFYPSGSRTFVRLVPNDYLQAATLVGWARERGARRIAVVQDERLFGRELAAQVRFAADRLGVAVSDSVEARSDDPSSHAALARRIANGHPDAVVYTGIGDAATGPRLAALRRALPGVPLYGASSLATAVPTPPGMPPVAVTKAALAPREYGPRARRTLARIARRRGAPVPVEALYGYEAMRVVLDALKRAGSDSDERPAVARAALAPRPRESVLGPYRVLASGDVSTARFGAFRLSADGLIPLGTRVAPPVAR